MLWETSHLAYSCRYELHDPFFALEYSLYVLIPCFKEPSLKTKDNQDVSYGFPTLCSSTITSWYRVLVSMAFDAFMKYAMLVLSSNILVTNTARGQHKEFKQDGEQFKSAYMR